MCSESGRRRKKEREREREREWEREWERESRWVRERERESERERERGARLGLALSFGIVVCNCIRCGEHTCAIREQTQGQEEVLINSSKSIQYYNLHYNTIL